ncbi:uncharacterized protein LOC141853102 [Brevipalpus obovatus]|uniref:uncharacterized protein LOC141853102 n=1 Tax=Brevipalpus obovatus TaxID=246614 RepID=UPI003D9F1DB9
MIQIHDQLSHTAELFANCDLHGSMEWMLDGLCEKIITLLSDNFVSSNTDTPLSLHEPQVRHWLSHINRGLRRIFAQNLDVEDLECIFDLVIALMDAFKSFDWILVNEKNDSGGDSVNQPETKDNYKTFPLLIANICSECDDEFHGGEDSFNGEIVKIYSYSRLTSMSQAFMLLEMIIETMADGEHSRVLRGIPSTVLASMKESLSDTVQGIIRSLKAHTSELGQREQLHSEGQGVLSRKAFAYAIRVMRLWLMENVSDEIELADMSELIPLFVLLLDFKETLELLKPPLESMFRYDPTLRSRIIKFREERDHDALEDMLDDFHIEQRLINSQQASNNDLSDDCDDMAVDSSDFHPDYL